MKKIILFSLAVVFIFFGCVRLFYPYTKTPKINKIDMALEMNEDGRYSAAREENRIYPKKTKYRFEPSEENIKKRNNQRGNVLSTVYEHTTLKKIKQEFNNIQAPCEDLEFNKIQCIYRAMSWINRAPQKKLRQEANSIRYIKITLTFTRENNKTTVEYEDIGCNKGRGGIYPTCTLGRDYRYPRPKNAKQKKPYNSTLPDEIEEYFSKIKANKSKE